MAEEGRKWRITLEDGRVLDLNADQSIRDARSAREYAQRWAAINPAGEEISTYNVRLGDGRVLPVPATSEEAAARFVEEVYTPTGRAVSDAQNRLSNAHLGIDGESTGQWDFIDQASNAATLGLTRQTNAGIAAGIAGLQNLGERLGIGEGAGYSAGDAYNASRAAENIAQSEWERANPAQAIGGGLLGGAGAPGVAAAGKFVTGARGAGGLLSQSLGGVAARSGAVGAGYGATQGLLNSAPGDEVGSTVRGGIVGGVVGGAVPIAARGATAAARFTGADQIPAVLNRATGGRIPMLNGSVERRNISRLVETMRQDGISEDQIRENVAEAVRRGITPNLLDAIGPNATRTRALIVGAAQAPGRGMTAGAQYANEVRGSLQDEAVGQAYRLTPGETRTAAAYSDDLGRTNRQLADELYAEPYRERVSLTDESRRALDGMGPQMNAARQESSFRFPDQAQDIGALANGGADDVSAAALDRINRQIGQAGRNAGLPGDNQNLGLAADYGARSGALNEVLDNVPGLLPARSTYRGYAAAQEGVEEGLGALRPQTRPADYIDNLDTLQRTEAASEMGAGIPLPSTREAAGVGLRDTIVQQLGGAREGAVGPLNNLAGRAESNNARQVLEATYGPEAADLFQGGMGILRDRGAMANFMDSTRGSPTAGRLTAGGMADAPGIPATLQAAMGLLSKIRRGVTLTDADREAIVQLGTRFGQMPPLNLGPRGAPVSGPAAPILSQQVE